MLIARVFVTFYKTLNTRIRSRSRTKKTLAPAQAKCCRSTGSGSCFGSATLLIALQKNIFSEKYFPNNNLQLRAYNLKKFRHENWGFNYFPNLWDVATARTDHIVVRRWIRIQSKKDRIRQHCGSNFVHGCVGTGILMVKIAFIRSLINLIRNVTAYR
jgi:hypothetical protein